MGLTEKIGDRRKLYIIQIIQKDGSGKKIGLKEKEGDRRKIYIIQKCI
jgi:hypothetical protein